MMYDNDYRYPWKDRRPRRRHDALWDVLAGILAAAGIVLLAWLVSR